MKCDVEYISGDQETETRRVVYMLQVETEPNTRRGELHIRPGHAASEQATLVRLFRSAATLW
jgi:hypothetical protein